MRTAVSQFRYRTQVPPRPRLALSLAILRAEADWLWPDRQRVSDGWIGDPAHRKRQSDHNPDRDGIVRALDLTCEGLRPRMVVNGALAHPATSYVIWDRRIWARDADFRAAPYHGPDPHTSHVHVSILPGAGAAGRHGRWLASPGA